MPDATIHTAGPVLQRLGPVLYRTELPNGKIILAHLSKRLADGGTMFEPGQRVVMELTLYDFEQARILGGEGDLPVFCAQTSTLEIKQIQSFADAETAENHA